MERREAQAKHFVPSATFEKIFTAPLFIFQDTLDREIKRTQAKNGQWAEETLSKLRGEHQEPFLDILLVDEKGEIVDTISSYRSYVGNRALYLSVADLAAKSQRRSKLIFPFSRS